MADLRLALAVAWRFLDTSFRIYGYEFSFAQVMIFGICASWLVWLWVNFILD